MKKTPLTPGSWVIRTTETDENNRGWLTGFAMDRKHCFVQWEGDTTTTRHNVNNICTLDDWRAIREEQKSLRDAWKAGAR